MYSPITGTEYKTAKIKNATLSICVTPKEILIIHSCNISYICISLHSPLSTSTNDTDSIHRTSFQPMNNCTRRSFHIRILVSKSKKYATSRPTYNLLDQFPIKRYSSSTIFPYHKDKQFQTFCFYFWLFSLALEIWNTSQSLLTAPWLSISIEKEVPKSPRFCLRGGRKEVLQLFQSLKIRHRLYSTTRQENKY